MAILARSNRCAASTADTIAPSKADRSTTSSVTRNFRARLKNADGPFDTLTAMTCLGWSDQSPSSLPSSLPCSEEWSESVPVVAASAVVGVVGVSGSLGLLTNDKEEIPVDVASVAGVGASGAGGCPASDFSPPLIFSDICSISARDKDNRIKILLSTNF